MSSYQGGRGGWGRGAGGVRGGNNYDNEGRGTYPDWRGSSTQHSAAGDAGRAGSGQYPNPNPRAQYPQPRGPHGRYMGTPRGPSPQQSSGAQNQLRDLNLRTPQLPRWDQRPLSQQKEGALPAQATQLMQTIPQATPMATGGGVAHEKEDAGPEEQMSALTIQPMTPPPSGSSKAMKFLHRPGKGTRGQRVIVRTNHFLVQLSGTQLHHYDVSIIPTVTSEGTNRVVTWTLVKANQQSHLAGRLPVYDGRKSLYTAGPLPFESKRFEVTLCDEDRPQCEANTADVSNGWTA